jgi:hypothetical protein
MPKPRHVGYNPAVIGWKAPDGRHGLGLEQPPFGTLQERTFFLSLVAQFGVLLLSGYAFILEGKTMHSILLLVLSLETVVQFVEFCWYFTVGAAYLCGYYHIDTGARYYDWAITTPVMLTTLMLYALWESDECLALRDVVEGERGAYLAVIIICDWLMLLCGYAYANKNEMLMGILDRSVEKLGFGENAGIYLGWIPFLLSFTPLFIMMSTEKFKLGGILSISISFVAWALYGVVAVMTFFHGTLSEEQANTAYNLLDIVSKNVLGVVVSTVVLSRHGATADDCHSPPSLPPSLPFWPPPP